MARVRFRRRQRDAFTLVHALAFVCIAAVLVPMLRHANKVSDRIKCSQNLRQIAMAAIMYANDEVRNGAFPRTTFAPGIPPTQYIGWQGKAAFGPGGPAPNDVTAALYLLVKSNRVPADSFVCPATRAAPWDGERPSPRP